MGKKFLVTQTFPGISHKNSKLLDSIVSVLYSRNHAKYSMFINPFDTHRGQAGSIIPASQRLRFREEGYQEHEAMRARGTLAFYNQVSLAFYNPQTSLSTYLTHSMINKNQ